LTLFRCRPSLHLSPAGVWIILIAERTADPWSRERTVTDQDFELLLKRGHETHGVEFKGPGKRTSPAFLAKVIRAMMGMANRRDGGVVIIGVEDDTLEPVGLEEDQADTWAYDPLATAVNEYASPSVSFDIEKKVYQGLTFVVLEVHEFAEIPILCVKEYHPTNVKGAAPILRRGACYVRSRHKPETSEIPSEEEMRELLELAIDKGVRRFVERAQKAGLFQPVQPPPAAQDDEARFDDQIKDMG
jgi:predicted HTH transcriptional regulator